MEDRKGSKEERDGDGLMENREMEMTGIREREREREGIMREIGKRKKRGFA